MRCVDCWEPIEPGDDARVCVQCGGRNLRVNRQPSFWRGFWNGLAIYPVIVRVWRRVTSKP